MSVIIGHRVPDQCRADPNTQTEIVHPHPLSESRPVCPFSNIRHDFSLVEPKIGSPSATMLSHSQPTSKNSLTITLTEPVVILRTVDVAGAHSPPIGGVSTPSILRGLLALDLVKPTRISSIEVELQAISHASWSEGSFDIVLVRRLSR